MHRDLESSSIDVQKIVEGEFDLNRSDVFVQAV